MVVSAGFYAQYRDAVPGGGFPFQVEVPRVVVEEQVPGEVECGFVAAASIREEGASDSVGREDVHAAVAHIGGSVDRVEDAPDAEAPPPANRGAVPRLRWRDRRFGGVGEVEEMDPFGLVELERTAQRLEYRLRGASEVPALESRVVACSSRCSDPRAAPPRRGVAP
jgi:hypothetical protein